MKILVLQETDWLTRGPHTQHHICERLSLNPKIKITILDYDIDKLQHSKSIFIKKKRFFNIHRTLINSNVEIIRTAHLQIPYLRRISSLISNFFEILNIIRKNHPDIIIGFSITNGLIGLTLAKLFRIPYIFYYIDVLHTLVPITYLKKLARIVSRFLFKFVDKIIVVTKLLQRFVLNEGAASGKVKVLLNGISLENTSVNPDKVKDLKIKFSIKDSDFVILFMGYLYEFAGLKEIIDFYNLDVKKGKIKLKFLIIGNGGIFNNLVEYVENINAKWVHLTGKVPFFDLPNYIELANLCLLSFDLNEITKIITPVKVMEYMSLKKPVLSNSLPGVILEIGKDNGVIFAKTQKELIKKIGELIPFKEELKKIGQKGYKVIEEKYVWANIIKDLEIVITNLIRNKKLLQ